MSNPLGGLVGYDEDDDEEEESDVEDRPEPPQMPTVCRGQHETDRDKKTVAAGGAAVSLVPRTSASHDGESDDQDDLYKDLIKDDDGGGGAVPPGGGVGSDPADDGGDDGPSPVGRADAIDAQTDNKPEPSSAVPSPRAAAESGSPGGGGPDGLVGASTEAEQGASPEPEAVDPRLVVPPAPGPCPSWLQDRVSTLLETQRATGKAVLKVLRDNRDYRNPAFMEKMVQHYGVFQYGTSFPPETFDTTAFPKEDYWAELNRALEDKRAERKRSRIESQRKAARVVNAAALPPPAATPMDVAVQLAQKVRSVGQKAPSDAGPTSQPKRSKWDRL